jgi:hypothetical protein
VSGEDQTPGVPEAVTDLVARFRELNGGPGRLTCDVCGLKFVPHATSRWTDENGWVNCQCDSCRPIPAIPADASSLFDHPPAEADTRPRVRGMI